jgi:predicted dehydrogenase
LINIGLIGLGKMGISHCAILNSHDDVNLVAVCDTAKFVTSALKPHTNFSFYSDYKKLINSCDIDAVFVASPTVLHKPIVEYILDHDCHVFCEKPLTLSPLDSMEITEKAIEKNLVTQVGYHNKFIATFKRACDLVKKGAIGEITHIHGEAYGPVVLKEKAGGWRAKREEGGGCLYDYAIHVIDLMNWMVGKPSSVSGTELQSIYSKSVDDAVYATFGYLEGMSGQLSVNWSDASQRKMSTRITIDGRKGKIIVDALECSVFTGVAVPEEKLEKGWNIQYGADLESPVNFYLRGEEYSAQIDYFVTSIKNNRVDGENSFASATHADEVVEMLKNNSKEEEIA